MCKEKNCGKCPDNCNKVIITERGLPGRNAFTLRTASFVQPTIGAFVSIAVEDSSWAVSGQEVFVGGGGYYEVVGIPSGTAMLIKNLGYDGNAAPGATVSTSNAKVSPGGLKGTDGEDGINGSDGEWGKNAYTFVSLGYSQPAAGANVAFQVSNAGLFTGMFATVGQIVYVNVGGHYQVVSRSETELELKYLGIDGTNPGGSVPAGAYVAPAGLPGRNAFTKTTQDFAQPNVGGDVFVTMSEDLQFTGSWMTPGQNVFIEGGGYYSVMAFMGVTVLIKNIGYEGNAVAGTNIATGARVAPAGVVGPQNPFFRAEYQPPAIPISANYSVGSGVKMFPTQIHDSWDNVVGFGYDATTGEFTVPETGYYDLHGAVYLISGANGEDPSTPFGDGFFIIGICSHDGGNLYAWQSTQTGPTTANLYLTCSTQGIHLAQGVRLKLMVLNRSSLAYTPKAGTGVNFSVRRIK